LSRISHLALLGYKFNISLEEFQLCSTVKTSVTPTDAQLHSYVFFCYLAPGCFGIVAIFRELTPKVL